MSRAGMIVLLLLVVASPAGADEVQGNADLTTGGGVAGHASYTSGGGGPSVAADSGKQPVVRYGSFDVTYTVIGDGPARLGDFSNLCWIGEPPEPGFQYRIIATDTRGREVDDWLVCVPFAEPGVKPTAPRLPEPPTIEEVWGAAAVPLPAVITDPPNRGITGLETRVTTTGPRTVTLDLAIRGYHLVGTARLDHYTISIDGAHETRADHDAFTFETKGNHAVTITAVWLGTATLTGPGIPAPVMLDDIGQATMTSTRTYPVHEIRSVLQPG